MVYRDLQDMIVVLFHRLETASVPAARAFFSRMYDNHRRWQQRESEFDLRFKFVFLCI